LTCNGLIDEWLAGEDVVRSETYDFLYLDRVDHLGRRPEMGRSPKDYREVCFAGSVTLVRREYRVSSPQLYEVV